MSLDNLATDRELELERQLEQCIAFARRIIREGQAVQGNVTGLWCYLRQWIEDACALLRAVGGRDTP